MGLIASGQLDSYLLASGAIAAQLALRGNSIASLALLNQMRPYSGAITIAPATGLYAISMYVETVQGGLLNRGSLTGTVEWVSESRSQSHNPITDHSLLTSGAMGQARTIVRALSGTPLIMSVSLGSPVGIPIYNIFGCVERLA